MALTSVSYPAMPAITGFCCITSSHEAAVPPPTHSESGTISAAIGRLRRGGTITAPFAGAGLGYLLAEPVLRAARRGAS